MSFTVVLAGRPNVGKSTLFNRLVGKSMALVNDVPGVTRDWREGEGHLFDLSFRVIDTAGLEELSSGKTLSARAAQQTRKALDYADVIVFVVDAREGVTADENAIAKILRKTGRPILLVANKCEGVILPPSLDDSVALGFGEPLPISAAHGEGMMELYEALLSFKPEDETVEELPEEKSLIMAVVGRPNAGKSTLVNKLLGEERMLTGPEPGLTRDAIPIAWSHKGRPIRLVDTAGMRRKAKVTEALERLSVQESLRAVRLAHVVVLVLDATSPFDKQDLVLARHVADEGRALVVALNKWDLVPDKKLVARQIREKAEASLAQLDGLPLMPICALTGEGLDALLDEALRLYDVWNIRLSTGPLNRWLHDMQEAHPLPIVSGRRLKIRYMTQIKSRPPTFALWVNKPSAMPESYLRFLARGLRQTFGLGGVPLRLQVKGGENPYDDKTKKK
ncbi:MAG: ribosome biogenesis GTPase Der [Alphaproteobacteria bacterium]|nr:ribosome biogenesis GTPase Der [Alphaproteobacteria bacterium]